MWWPEWIWAPIYGLRSIVGTVSRPTIQWANTATVGAFSFASNEHNPFSGFGKVISGDFDGDGFDDLLAYTPGVTTAKIRWGATNRSAWSVDYPSFFSGGANFTKVFVGDFNGDGRDDVFVYGAGSLADYIRFGAPSRMFSTVPYTVSGTYEPFVGNFDGTYGDDIFWYHAGDSIVHRWYSTGGTQFTQLNWYSVDPGGPFTPIVGNFDGAYGDDIFWYLPGSGQDRIWYSLGGGSTSFTKMNGTNVNGTYASTVAGDFNGDGKDDIYWHSTANQWDFVWPGTSPGQFGTISNNAQMYHVLTPTGGDFDGDGRTDIYWR